MFATTEPVCQSMSGAAIVGGTTARHARPHAYDLPTASGIDHASAPSSSSDETRRRIRDGIGEPNLAVVVQQYTPLAWSASSLRYVLIQL